MEAVSQQTLIVDLRKRASVIIPHFIQGDTNIITFVIKENGEDADLSNIETVLVNYRRSDNKVVSRELQVSGNTVEYHIGNDEMKTAGTGEVELKFYDEDQSQRLSTIRMKVNIIREIGAGMEGEDTPTLIQQLLVNGQYAEEQGAYAEQQGDLAKQAADTSITNWLSPVADYTAVEAISSPSLGDTVQTNDNGYVYRFDGTEWVNTQQYGATALANVNAQLEEKATYAEVRKNTNTQPINVNEMDTETKQLFTGGSVAVVGEKAVGSENLKDLAVRFTHTDFLEYGDNFFNPYTVKDGFSVNSTGVELVDATYSVSEFIAVVAGTLYIIIPNGTTIKRPTFYNLSKEYVATIFSSTSTTPIEYTPSTDGFIRVPVLTTGKFNVSVSKKNVQPSFTPFRIKGKNYLLMKPDAGSVGSLELQDKVVTPQKTNFLEPSKNLFNENDEGVTPDAILGTGTANTSYETSGYMEIKAGQSYNISHPRKYETSDINKLNPVVVDVNPIASTSFTAQTDGYLRVTYLKTDRNVLQVELGTAKTDYEEYGKVKMPGLIIPGQTNELAGKKILNFGDSISASSVGYHAIIAERNNMTFRNLGAGGYTVTSVDGSTNTIISRVNTAISEGQTADYILFNGLTNDANVLDVSLAGTISTGYNATLDMSTFAGSFEHLIKTLITTWQDAKIIYIRPHNMDSRDSRQITYGDLALDICRKWSIPFVDMFNEGGLNTHIPELKVRYTVDTYSTGLGDGTHPNEEGYRMYYAPRIEAKMKGI